MKSSTSEKSVSLKQAIERIRSFILDRRPESYSIKLEEVSEQKIEVVYLSKNSDITKFFDLLDNIGWKAVSVTVTCGKSIMGDIIQATVKKV